MDKNTKRTDVLETGDRAVIDEERESEDQSQNLALQPTGRRLSLEEPVALSGTIGGGEPRRTDGRRRECDEALTGAYNAEGSNSLKIKSEKRLYASPKSTQNESEAKEDINNAPSSTNPGKRNPNNPTGESTGKLKSIIDEFFALLQMWFCVWRLIGGCALLWLARRLRKVLEEYEDKRREKEDDPPPKSSLEVTPVALVSDSSASIPTPQLVQYTPMFKNNKERDHHVPVPNPAAAKLITQVASEMFIFGPIDGDCYGKIHERVYATANEEREAADAGKPLRIRPARVVSDQAAYLGSYNTPAGEQIHCIVLLNADFTLFNSATGEMVHVPGHFFGQLHPIPRYGPRPPMVPRVNSALVESCVSYAQAAATHASVRTLTSPLCVEELTRPQRLHLPRDLQQDSLCFTADSTAGMTANFPTVSAQPIITNNGQRTLTYSAQYQLKNEHLKAFDPRKCPDTPTSALPMVLYTGLASIPEAEEGEIIQDGCIDPQCVLVASNVQAEETNQKYRRMLVRKVKSEPELFRSNAKEVRTEDGEISERGRSAPPLIPHFPSTASTPANENAQRPKEDLQDYVMVPAPRHAYKPGCVPAQILEAAAVFQPTPDRYTLTPVPFGPHTTHTTHSLHDSIYGSSDDDDLPSLRYPESSTDSLSGNEFALRLLTLTTETEHDKKPTLYSQKGYSLYAYQRDVEQDKDEGAACPGCAAIDLMHLDTTRMIDRFAMSQGKLFNYEDLRREREIIHEEQGRDLAAPSTPASIYLDDDDVNETDLDQVSTRVGIAMRRIPDDAQPTTDLYDQYPPIFSPEAHEYGPTFRIAIMVAVNQRRDTVRILRNIRGDVCEFITRTYDMIASRCMSIDLADAQRDGPAPLPFLRPLEHLKLRIVYHMYQRYGNNTISDVAGQLLQFVFREAESRATNSTPEQGWELEVRQLTVHTNITSMPTYALITGVACRAHLPHRTLTVVFRDSTTTLRGSAALPPAATALLPLMQGFILTMTPLRLHGDSVNVVHARLAGRRLLRDSPIAIYVLSLLAWLLPTKVFAEGLYILLCSIHAVFQMIARAIFRQVMRQVNTAEVYSVHVADLEMNHSHMEIPGAFSLQDPEEEDLLEEDDEFIFYPVTMKNEAGRDYQAFTMYKRVDKKIRPVSTTFSPDYAV
ncbi:hypothetical protein C8R45DRAFT_931004 [Mycena sanguinolenta]|nr:hypothetical protein C8R45DRAFT_931004 [Mycena sanguinolenta]